MGVDNRLKLSALCLVFVCLSYAHACDFTITDTTNLYNDFEGILASGDYVNGKTICLNAATYEGCGSGTLMSFPSGGPPGLTELIIRGAGINKTVLNCPDPFYLETAATNVLITDLMITGTSASTISQSALTTFKRVRFDSGMVDGALYVENSLVAVDCEFTNMQASLATVAKIANGASVSFTNCVFDTIMTSQPSNAPLQGADANDVFNLLLDGCTFVDVQSHHKGFAVAGGASGSVVLVKDTQFVNGNGIAVYCNTGGCELNNVTVRGYTARLSGVAVSAPYSDYLRVIDSTFESNVATSSVTQERTGVVYTRGVEASISRTMFKSNLAEFGTGIRAIGCNLTVDECSFVDNDVSLLSGKGAGVHAELSDVNMTDCVFHNNTAVRYAAVYLANCDFKFINGVFGGNYATSGGTVGVKGGSGMLSGSTFSANSAVTNVGSAGGALWLVDADDVAVTNCSFYANTGRYGGGLHADKVGSLSVDNCDFDSNYGFRAAGIYLSNGTSATVTDTTMLSNTASNGGGAVGVDDSGTSFAGERVSFTDNSATHAGAIAVRTGAIISLENCDVTDNVAVINGVIFVEDSSASIRSSTIQDNNRGIRCNNGMIDFSNTKLCENGLIDLLCSDNCAVTGVNDACEYDDALCGAQCNCKTTSPSSEPFMANGTCPTNCSVSVCDWDGACGPHGVCAMPSGWTFNCNCNPGYTNEGGEADGYCVDLNECASNTTLCNVTDMCVNTNGSYTCVPLPTSTSSSTSTTSSTSSSSSSTTASSSVATNSSANATSASTSATSSSATSASVTSSGAVNGTGSSGGGSGGNSTSTTASVPTTHTATPATATTTTTTTTTTTASDSSTDTASGVATTSSDRDPELGTETDGANQGFANVIASNPVAAGAGAATIVVVLIGVIVLCLCREITRRRRKTTVVMRTRRSNKVGPDDGHALDELPGEGEWVETADCDAFMGEEWAEDFDVNEGDGDTHHVDTHSVASARSTDILLTN